MKIVVGAVISRSLPGEILHRAQYAEGLRRLGHEVLWIEHLEANACVDDHGRPTDYARCANRHNFVEAVRYLGLQDSSSQIFGEGPETVGLSYDRVIDSVSSADLLLNFSGHIRHREILRRIPRKAYLDSDPVFTQLWSAAYQAPVGLDSHDVFFTRGANLAEGRCRIPCCGIAWHPYMPPVVTDLWPATGDEGSRTFTTIAAWGRYGDLQYEGRWYRSKTTEFERFAELPSRVDSDFRLALSGREYDPPLAHRLEKEGWRVERGRDLDSIDKYLAFVRSSGAEIGVAKHAYVQGGAGWFSERSTQYMACGKPVLVQDTGLDTVLPTGCGILTFRTVDEAVGGAEKILGDYTRHSAAARELVEECFDFRVLLPELIERCFEGPSEPSETGSSSELSETGRGGG